MSCSAAIDTGRARTFDPRTPVPLPTAKHHRTSPAAGDPMTHSETFAPSTGTHSHSPEVTHARQTGGSSRPRAEVAARCTDRRGGDTFMSRPGADGAGPARRLQADIEFTHARAKANSGIRT